METPPASDKSRLLADAGQYPKRTMTDDWKHWPTALIGLVTLAALFWLAYPETPFTRLSGGPYELQAKSWLERRWDIPKIHETFNIGGKHYMYFGPLPAVFRLPLVLFPDWNVLDQRFFVFVAAFLNVIFALLVLTATANLMNVVVGRWTLAGFCISAGIGSTAVVIGARTEIYHEAIAWGSAFFLAAIWASICYMAKPSSNRMTAACAFCLLATLSRQTWLFGGLFLLLGLIWFTLKAKARRPRIVPIALAGLAGLILVPLAVSYVKFGWGLTPPLGRHAHFINDPARLARSGGAMLHLSNLRTGLVNYLAPDNIAMMPSFPFLMPPQRIHEFPETKLDGVEHFVSLPWVMGGFLLLSALALPIVTKPSGRGLGLAFSAAWLGAAPVLTFIGLCARYLHDFYPPLVLGAAVGLLWLVQSRNVALLAAVAALVIVNLWANWALAFWHQVTYSSVSRKAAIFSAMTTRVFIKSKTFQWDPTQPLDVEYRLDSLQPKTSYPLLTSGATGFGSFVWLRFDDEGRASYCYNMWGDADTPCSSNLTIKSAEVHRFRVSFESSMTRLVVRHDGAPVLSAPVSYVFHVAWVAANPIGGGLTRDRTPGLFAVVRP